MNTDRKRRWHIGGLSALVTFGLTQVALACAFHGYTPRPTLVDVLYDSEQVLLARPDPDNPRRYAPVAALMGDLAYAELPQTPDKATLSQLKAAPQSAVLFARDGSYGPWVKHGIVDQDHRRVLETVLARKDSWAGGTGKKRAQFFANQLNDPNPATQELALLELDRVDYQTLRSLRIKNLDAQIAAIEKGDPKLRPIRILLAGLSGDKRRAAILSNGVQHAARTNRRNLGAYATAMIELEGTKGINRLVDGYLSDARVSIDTQELIIEAMALQGLYGARAVKRTINRSMANLLAKRPQLAAPVARQYSRHGNWSLGDAVEQARAAAPPKTARDAVPITKYVIFAAKGGNASR